ncbi:MAG: CrcB family protein [Lactobacillales bacterium]|nr:CrcB family protein [Lactobacillales bacterium]
MTLFFLGIACSIGTFLRYFLQKAWSKRVGAPFSFAIFWINLIGSFCLGFLYSWTKCGRGVYYSILGIGFFGGFTTFSTLNVELYKLYFNSKHLFFTYLGLSYVLGIAFAMSGIFLGKIFVSSLC